MPTDVSCMTMFEKEQSRMTPSFVQPIRMPADHERSEQFEIITRSHVLFSLSERLLARTTSESSPVSIIQSEIVTSREQFTWMPSLFG